jgi:hypothetical protein
MQAADPGKADDGGRHAGLFLDRIRVEERAMLEEMGEPSGACCRQLWPLIPVGW